jgi:16S rRNA (adenine1518-N6/adenine1519-N6)-dimethyltransferase
MFQKEMAERIIGKFGTSKYGRLSILTNYRLNILNKFNVSPNCFFPKPKINSTVIHFKPHSKNQNILDIENLEKITNIFFSNKRKMINKNVKKILKSSKNIKLIKNLNLKARPQDLEPKKYYEITEFFEKI